MKLSSFAPRYFSSCTHSSGRRSACRCIQPTYLPGLRARLQVQDDDDWERDFLGRLHQEPLTVPGHHVVLCMGSH